ncbi:hypothetical protein SVIOM342S_06047 [Streptomyces violaceorubidus]
MAAATRRRPVPGGKFEPQDQTGVVGRSRRMRGARDSGAGRLVIRASMRRQREGGTVSPQASMTEA